MFGKGTSFLKRIPVIVYLALGASAIAAVFAALNPLLAPDTICRHAPMAEAFAHGNWAEAFHPRFGVGFPIVSGLACLIGLDGLSASCVVASLAWGLAILPVYGIARRAFDERTAWFAVILYILCPQMLIWSVRGLREPFKVLGILLAVEAILASRGGGWRNVARAAAGLALLAWFKVDTVILVPCFWLGFAFGDRFRAKAWALALAAALMMVPNCWLVYDWTGVPLPALQYADIWRHLAC